MSLSSYDVKRIAEKQKQNEQYIQQEIDAVVQMVRDIQIATRTILNDPDRWSTVRTATFIVNDLNGLIDALDTLKDTIPMYLNHVDD